MTPTALAVAPDWPDLLADACAGEGLRPVYQPLVDLQRGQVVGYEGLSRFPKAPEVSPDRWFAAARAHGCEDELEAATLTSVLAARDDLPPDTFLSVNVSPTTLASSPVARALASRDLDGVVIELTEQVPVHCYVELSRHLDRYRDRGALVALDDAGSGYAGLSHILELRPSILKLDRTLIRGVDRDEAKRVLVEMLARYATQLGGWILAEGIETLSELETLRRLGVPYGQGWALGRPAGPWAGLDPDAAAVLGDLPLDPDDRGCPIQVLAERARTVPAAGHVRAAVELAGEPADAFVVVTDDLGAPVGAYTPGAARAGRLHPVLCVSPSTPVAEVARRALNRPPERRFEPVVCTDPAGRTVGVVRIERVLEHLARLMVRFGG